MQENDNIVHHQVKVCQAFNSFSVNVAKILRTENQLDDLEIHESVRKILERRASSCISLILKPLMFQVLHNQRNLTAPKLQVVRKSYKYEHKKQHYPHSLKVDRYLVEAWKAHLRNSKKIGAVLMDLSKAFCCMSHSLLEIKLKAFGVGKNSVELIKSYLQCRKQRVEFGQNYITWLLINKGVPQGSILGPLLFQYLCK